MKADLLAILICSLAFGCSTYKPPQQLAQHVVIVNKDGRLLTLDGKEAPVDTNHYALQPYFDLIVTNAIQQSPRHPCTQKKQILLFVHGGMNEAEGSLKRADRLTNPTNANVIPRNQYYPIFINWNSGFVSSYAEQLFFVRYGRLQKGAAKWKSATLAPFYLARDAGLATARYPLTVAKQLATDFNTLPWSIRRFRTLEEKEMEERFLQFRAKYFPEHSSEPHYSDPVIRVSMGHNQLGGGDVAKTSYRYVFFLPFRLLTAWVVDIGGSAAWINMSRRVDTMFRSPLEDSKTFDVVDSKPTGGVAQFFSALSAALANDRDEYEITLIGHSMGTMVLNEAIRQYGNRFGTNAVFKNIVYMAGACSVRDVQQCVVPYLQSHREANFYALSLHPLAERREESAYHYAPRGTLLEWIDHVFGIPKTVPDGTFGRWENLMLTAHEFPEDVRSRVHLKAFGVEGSNKPGTPFGDARSSSVNSGSPCFPEGNPQLHGSFSTDQFWVQQFWEPK